MYAEVYKFFPETSGRGLAQEVAKAMKPRPATKESNIAEEIEAWEGHMNRLARHGPEYELAPVFKMEALKTILGHGKMRDHFDLWFAEDMSYEQILKKIKDEARAAKLDTDVTQGKAGVAMGDQGDTSRQQGPQQFATGNGQWSPELYAFNGKGGKGGGKNKRSRSPAKGYGKGTDKGGDKGKGKGKSQQTNLNAATDRHSKPPPGFTGCWWCNSLDHYARDCPKGKSQPTATMTPANVITLCGVRVTDTKSSTPSGPRALEGQEEVSGIPTTRNPFSPLEPNAQDDSHPPPLTDSETEEEEGCPPPPVGKWTRVKRVKSKRKVDHPSSIIHRHHHRQNCSCQRCPPTATGDSASNGESPEAQEENPISILIPQEAEHLNGISQSAEEFEEVDFMVDSGAGHTVIGPEHVKAVTAGEPKSWHYTLADGSAVPHMGDKKFRAVTEDYQPHDMHAQITECVHPLLSVSQIVLGGHTVVFSPKGSYIDLKAGGKYGAGRRIPMRKDGNIYMLKMWVPREQPESFQGPVETKP